MRGCALFGHMPDPTTDLDITLGIVRIEYRKRYNCAFFHITCLHATFRRIYPDLAVRVVEPYERNFRCPIRHDCRQMRKRRFLLQ
jgi:hypothetical protein